MKSFYAMPLVEEDPGMGLLIEDELPACVDMTGYEGPRGVAEVLALATRASEITQLAEIAQRLGLGDVRVIRTGGGATPVSVFAPYDYECLGECGATIFAISDFDGLAADSVEGLQVRFIWMAMLLAAGYEPRWHQLVYYKIAVRYAGAKFVMPPRLVPVEAMTMLEPWWQLPVSATTRQVHLLADRVADLVSSWENAPHVIRQVKHWILNYQGAHDDFDRMLSDLERDRSLSCWKLVR